MGLSSSSVRKVAFIGEEHNISLRLGFLTNQSRRLAQASSDASLQYQKDLNAQKYKLSNNSGITTYDLSYDILMKPNQANLNKPTLITDSKGRVVVDSKFRKFAELISPNGAPGGDYASHRAEILSQLVDIPAEKIEASKGTSQAVADAQAAAYDAQTAYNNHLARQPKSYFTDSQFGAKLGNYNDSNLADLFRTGGSYKIGSYSGLESLVNKGIKQNVKNYLTDEDYKHFEEACNAALKNYKQIIEGSDTNSDRNRESAGISGSSGSYEVNIQKLFENILGRYIGKGGTTNSSGQYYTIDKSSTAWQEWNTKCTELETAYNEKLKALQDAIDEDNRIFSTGVANEINFYEQIFIAIAEKGWVEDLNISDNDYLNNMLQNGEYTVTTMRELPEEIQLETNYMRDITERTNPNARFLNMYDYDMNIASNVSNFFLVSDDQIVADAQAKYEAKKADIKIKSDKIDDEKARLQTRLQSIQQMKKTVESAVNKNIERTMNLFA